MNLMAVCKPHVRVLCWDSGWKDKKSFTSSYVDSVPTSSDRWGKGRRGTAWEVMGFHAVTLWSTLWSRTDKASGEQLAHLTVAGVLLTGSTTTNGICTDVPRFAPPFVRPTWPSGVLFARDPEVTSLWESWPASHLLTFYPHLASYCA